MAIVEMKKITLAGLDGDRDAIIKRLQALGCVQIDESGDSGDKSSSDSQLTRLRDVVSLLKLHGYKKQKFGRRTVIPTAELQKPEETDEALEAVLKLEKLRERARDIKSQLIRLGGTVAQLMPWEQLGAPLESIANTRETWIALGTLSARETDGLFERIREDGILCEITEISKEGDVANVLLVAHMADAEALSPMLSAAGWSRVELKFTGTAAQNIAACKKQAAEAERELKAQENEIALMNGEIARLERMHDHAMLEYDREEAVNRMALTETSFILSGWVPAPHMAAVEAAVSEITQDYYIAFEDPSEDDAIPTLLSNDRIVRNFETITNMYSPPDARGFDPNTIMTPFYACFFGMMVSDAAYGVLLTVFALLALRLYKFRGEMGKILGVIAVGGVATLFWGALFGGWFGLTASIKWFSPMEDPIMMLILCYSLGAIHIFTGMGISAYISIKEGKWQDAVFDQISWIVLIIGIVCLVFEPIRPLGIVMAAAGLLTILLFAGRDKKNFVSRIIGGLGALYGITSYLSDILSYSRLFAMGLATGVIGMVFNTLAEMLGGNPIGMGFAVLVLIVGHVFNLAINTLGAYVHACRLQYIEFYGKFYASGGTPFKPLRARTTYVDTE